VHWADAAQLQQMQQVADALPQLKEGDSPPSGSPIFQLAPLLWLLPAVLLERLQKQPAGRPHSGLYQSTFCTLWFSFLETLKMHANFWDAMQAAYESSAGGQQENAASSAFKRAARVAAGFSMCCQPLASQLVQLLHLTSRVHAYMMAYMQDAPTVSMLTGGSSGGALLPRGSARDSATCPTSSSHGSGAPGGSSGHRKGDVQMQQTLLMLLQASSILLQMLRASLRTDKLARSAAPHYAASSTFGSAVGPSAATDSEQQASLASLCAALQLTLPQFASLTEAAMRSLSGVSSQQHSLLQDGGCMLRELCDQGMFVAAGLQHSNPALKPLSGLAFSLLKLASGVLANPQADEQDASSAISCLSTVMRFNALILQAACATSSSADSCSSSRAAVISMLSHSTVSTGPWNPAQISNIAGVAGSSATSTPHSTSSSNIDPDVLVPWLVSLGRCCVAYTQVLQQSQAQPAAVWGLAAQSSQQNMEFAVQALLEVAGVLPAWLQSDSVSARLATAGYSIQQVTELLQLTEQAGQNAPQAGAAAAASFQLLQQLGLALSNLPAGTACNNPRCTTLAGLSEQQLVVGRARLCAGCRVARYCCRACQVAAWKQHKPACKAMASACAAKAAEQAA
jgi:hypothetical protein